MSLKITDLSVGDWVSIDGEPRKINTINGISGIVSFNGLGNYCGTGVIEPIPITAEVLEKNGFVENLGRWYNSEYFMEFEPNKGAWDRTINCGEYSVYTIKYVHQLQHALRLAGVDKEITL
jgi:hypothetical protein